MTINSESLRNRRKEIIERETHLTNTVAKQIADGLSQYHSSGK